MWRTYPGLCNERGEPASWQAMQYAMGHHARSETRIRLRNADSVRAAGTTKEEYADWRRTLKPFSGW